jgi:hypothetical protein
MFLHKNNLLINSLFNLFVLHLLNMAGQLRYMDLDLVSRGYKLNPDWNRDFRENQDKITKVMNGILDIELGHYIKQGNTMLSEVYFTKHWGYENYCLVYKIKEKYNNVGILIGTILESTDKVLRWYDLTTKFNFNIVIISPHETFRFTYLDLLYEYITMQDGSGRHESIGLLLDTHPRARQMEKWVTRYREYKRVTQKTKYSNHPYSNMEKNGKPGWILQLRYDDDDSLKRESMNRYVDGGLRMSIPIEPRQIVERESLITRMKNKLKL